MKRKSFIIIFLLAFCGAVFAGEVFRKELVWGEPQQVLADSVAFRMLSFDGAVLLGRVPYALIEIPVKPSVSQQFSLQNIKFQPLSLDEKQILEENACQPSAEVSLSVQKNNSEYILLFLPFVCKDGVWEKVVSYEILTDETTVASSLAKALSTDYVSRSSMSSGTWVKMEVSSSGVYKLTYDDIVSAGIDPADLHILGYGGALVDEDLSKPHPDDLPEVAYSVYAGADGVFGKGDYVLFYAQGPISWEYDRNLSEYKRIRNPYSDKGCYFLASGIGGGGRKMQTLAEVMPPAVTSPMVYDSSIDPYIYENDICNLPRSGREFYGEEFSISSKNISLSFEVPNLLTDRNFKVRFDGATQTVSNSGTTYFNLIVAGRSHSVGTNNISTSDLYTKGKQATGLYYGTCSSSKIPISIEFQPHITTAKGWLNYITITAERSLVMNGNQMTFCQPTYRNGYAQFNVLSVREEYEIWDITDLTEIARVPFDFSNGVASFYANSTGVAPEYVMVNPNGTFEKPQIGKRVANQNLHGTENAELVIITNEEYLEASLRLAKAHQELDNMSVLVVTAEQVYNEFSSGTPDATAYRRLMKMFYDRNRAGLSSTAPKYLLLMGDGTYDNRQILPSPDGCNKLLTYQSEGSLSETGSFVIDDYFGFLDDSGSGDKFVSTATLDIGVGRIPANTKEMAEGVVDKIVRYMNNKSAGEWKNKLLFIADDGDNASHTKQADSVANMAIKDYPEFQVEKLYLDAFDQQTSASNEAYPQVREKFLNQIKNGLLYLNYVGHGRFDYLTNEKILTQADITEMRNKNQAFWVAATCDFARFDSPTITAGEETVLNTNGGAIALFSTARTVFSEPNSKLNAALMPFLLSRDAKGKRLRLGDIVKNAKVNCTSTMYENKLSFLLFGDPALRLTAPTYYVETESINGVAADEVSVGALDKMTIVGYISDGVSQMSDFNGTIYVTIYDKEAKVKTLNNDGGGAVSGIYEFRTRTEIFSGRTLVENGKFTIDLMLPKDIDYEIGDAKINYYAWDENNDYEANGYEMFELGGFSEDADFDDEEGPEIEIYLNTTNFRSGDTVSPNALFVAYVSDENGINISNSGIGHDIAIKIDNGDWVVLNDYYESDTGTYKSGTVRYTLPDLEDGTHTLTFRAWDLLNNSSSRTIEFSINPNASVDVTDVYCYPNPARDEVTFVFSHDRPDEVLSVKLNVFDMTGRKIWTYDAEIDTDYNDNGNTLTVTTWDLTSPSGTSVQNGIYLFNVEVKGETGKSVSKTKKLVVAK